MEKRIDLLDFEAYLKFHKCLSGAEIHKYTKATKIGTKPQRQTFTYVYERSQSCSFRAMWKEWTT